jgi:hypothetical protein
MKTRLAWAGAIGLTLLLCALLLAPGATSARSIAALSPLSVTFTYAPLEPSIYDTVTFADTTLPPPSEPFAAYEWAFGDGGTGSGPAATHKYAGDGTYSVTHKVTTGLTQTSPIHGGSTATSVHVRTDDVSVAQVSAPVGAREGQTLPVVVSVSNQRYAETVEVELQSSALGSFSPVGILKQLVPVQAAGAAPTRFEFQYTFSSLDKELGQVIFKAIATIIGPRDARPVDNERASAPTIMVEPDMYLPLINQK